MSKESIVQPVYRDMTNDVPHMKIEHRLVGPGGAARGSDQQVDVLLDDLRHRRHPGLMGENRMLRDLEGLTIGVKQTLQGLGFDFGSDSKACCSWLLGSRQHTV